MRGAVRLVQEVETEQTPDTVTFSSDGRWLAYGDGSWYGSGHIVCMEPGRGVVAALACRDVLAGEDENLRHISVSGLCFDGADHFLAISAWLWSQKFYPALLFRIEGSEIVPHLTCIGRRTGRPFIVDDSVMDFLAFPTGVRLHDGKLILRRWAARAEDALSVYALPSEVQTTGILHHLTSSRIALLGGAVVTGFDRLAFENAAEYLKKRNPRSLTRSFEGALLIIAGLDATGGIATVRVLPTPHRWGVGAITADVTGETLITAGHDDSIARWQCAGETGGLPDLKLLSTRRLAGELESELSNLEATFGELPSSFYGEISRIEAACYLCGGELSATADTEGRIRLWRGDDEVLSWSVPTARPRSMAAHPARPWLAIACDSSTDHRGRIMVYDVGSAA